MKNAVRYPWDKWLSRRKQLVLTKGVDYHCQPHSMAQQFRNAATRRGMDLSIHIDGQRLTILNKGGTR